MPPRIAPEESSLEQRSQLDWYPLYAFAYLLTGDSARAAGMADDAFGRAIEPSGHRDAVVVRARVAAGARKAPTPAADPPVVRALASCSHEERTVLICVVHERMTSAETAFVARCEGHRVGALLARATMKVASLIHPDVSDASIAGVLRMELLAAIDGLGEPPRPSPAGRRRPVILLGLLAVTVLATAWMTRSNATSEPIRSRDVFHSARGGYRVIVHEAWRSLPTVAAASAQGVDPARLGLASHERGDDTAVFIPRRARERPAMLRITVVRSFYDEALALFREQLADRQAALGSEVTSVEPTELAARPGTMFRISYPDDHATCAGCRSVIRVVHWFGGTTMIVEEQGPYPVPRAMVRSVAPAPGMQAYEPVAGSAASTVGSDEHLDTLLRFLDARARHGEPERWLADAIDVDPRALGGVVGYEVLAREGDTFTVEVEISDRFGRRRELLEERITVGGAMRRGRAWPSVIRRIEVRAA